jgi:hypothetical protein
MHFLAVAKEHSCNHLEVYEKKRLQRCAPFDNFAAHRFQLGSQLAGRSAAS